MDNQSARLFLESLLERVVHDPNTGKNSIPGTLSAHEISALETALQVLGGEASARVHLTAKPAEENLSEKRAQVEPQAASKVENVVVAVLDLKSLDLENAADEQIILCLDFGTAMSKAFATVVEDDEAVKSLPLKLGRQGAKGGQLYPVPSSLWIASDGLIYFGEQAIALSMQESSGTRQRFDSLKKELIMGLVDVSLDRVPLCPEINPTQVVFSKGDAITLYLGYLTDLACSELEINHNVSRYVYRRFALPPWEEKRREWGESMLSKMLAQAQIIADTFHGRWENGISIEEAKSALEKVGALRRLPNYLIGDGVSEPLAAGTSRFRKEEKARGLAMVIDVGAGTSDFALFVVSEDPVREIFKAWPIKGCNESLQQAGDNLDFALLRAILDKAMIDISNPDYPFIVTGLRMNLRTLKEELFREGYCTYNLSNGDRGTIELETFLKQPAVQTFGVRLNETFQSVLARADKSFIDRFNGGMLTIVLTGGGATLPMVTDLSEGSCSIHGIVFQKALAPLVPEEYVDHPELGFVYSQLAVAIGGTLPNLIEEKNAITEMPGLLEQQWKLGQVQISGV